MQLQPESLLEAAARAMAFDSQAAITGGHCRDERFHSLEQLHYNGLR